MHMSTTCALIFCSLRTQSWYSVEFGKLNVDHNCHDSDPFTSAWFVDQMISMRTAAVLPGSLWQQDFVLPMFRIALTFTVAIIMQFELVGGGFNLFTTIHDGNFRRHSSMNVTIK